MASVTRRDALRIVAAGFGLSVAGCLSTETRPGTQPAEPVPDSTRHTESAIPATTVVNDGEASAPPSCPDEYTPLDPWWVVEGPGPFDGFELTLSDREVALGDALAVTLTNRTNQERSTGNKQKFDVQYRSADGWHTIFGIEQDLAAYTDEGILHPPGRGFRWDLRFTRDGLSDVVDHAPTYHVCAPLEPGTYRFVYWGITTEREVRNEYQTDYAIGVPFDVIRSSSRDGRARR